jgi:hypothetical protein
MAWDDLMVPLLRDSLQDTAANPLYADDQLVTSLLVAGFRLQLEVSFGMAYRIDVVNQAITPDPTASTPPDNNFANLVSLRAALGLVVAELRSLTRGGIEIRDGDNMIKLARDPDALKLMRDSYQKLYDDAIYAFKTGGNQGLGEIIVTPYHYLSDLGLCGPMGLFAPGPYERNVHGAWGGR